MYEKFYNHQGDISRKNAAKMRDQGANVNWNTVQLIFGEEFFVYFFAIKKVKAHPACPGPFWIGSSRIEYE